jgi:hypothetical protein
MQLLRENMQLLRETQHELLTELCITYKHFFTM